MNGDTSSEGLGEPVLSAIDVRPYVDQILEDRATDPDKREGESTRGFIERANTYADLYAKDRKFPASISRRCKKCEFRTQPIAEGKPSGFQECWMDALGWKEEQFDLPHVFDLWNFRNDQVLNHGPFLLEDLDSETVFMRHRRDGGLDYKGKTAERQHLQLQRALDQDNDEVIDPALFDEMDSWKWPLHLIDFETSMVALPFTKGRRPYEQTAYQFSCHTLHKDGGLEHHEWIAREVGVFPNYSFVRNLKAVLEDDQGTIFRYAAHENTVLRQIHKQLESDQDLVSDAKILMYWIDSVTHWDAEDLDGKKQRYAGVRNMVDLCELVKRYYYQRRMGGSNSIKKVLPAVLSVSEFLRNKYSQPYDGTNHKGQIWWQHDAATGEVIDPYKLLSPLVEDAQLTEDKSLDLDAEVDDGGAALVAYGKLQFEDLPSESRERILQSLLRYCELDTLAMVMIVEHWLSKR